jgi:hypothetical protein
VESSRRDRVAARVGRLVRAVGEGDEEAVAAAVVGVSRSHRLLAPLAFAVGGLAALFNGLKLLVTNWRLTLVQVLPAMWIWVAMFDLKAHALHDKAFHPVFGPVLIPVVLAIAAVTAASFFLNAVFGFAIAGPGPPEVRPAVVRARSHLRVIVISGGIVGLALAFATAIVPRWGSPWFALSLGIVVGVMMVAYVAVPARLIGARPDRSRRDKLTASAVGGAMGVIVCTPPYLLGRIGLLMVGSQVLRIPGVVVLAVGITLQAGATGAVKAVKMSAALFRPDGTAPPVPAAAERPDTGCERL